MKKQVQLDLIESMALNSVLTGLEHKIGQILRVIVNFRRFLYKTVTRNPKIQQLPSSNDIGSKSNPPSFQKQCSFCKIT